MQLAKYGVHTQRSTLCSRKYVPWRVSKFWNIEKMVSVGHNLIALETATNDFSAPQGYPVPHIRPIHVMLHLSWMCDANIIPPFRYTLISWISLELISGKRATSKNYAQSVAESSREQSNTFAQCCMCLPNANTRTHGQHLCQHTRNLRNFQSSLIHG